jgi:hypothetical protein
MVNYTIKFFRYFLYLLLVLSVLIIAIGQFISYKASYHVLHRQEIRPILDDPQSLSMKYPRIEIEEKGLFSVVGEKFRIAGSLNGIEGKKIVVFRENNSGSDVYKATYKENGYDAIREEMRNCDKSKMFCAETENESCVFYRNNESSVFFLYRKKDGPEKLYKLSLRTKL